MTGLPTKTLSHMILCSVTKADRFSRDCSILNFFRNPRKKRVAECVVDVETSPFSGFSTAVRRMGAQLMISCSHLGTSIKYTLNPPVLQFGSVHLLGLLCLTFVGCDVNIMTISDCSFVGKQGAIVKTSCFNRA